MLLQFMIPTFLSFAGPLATKPPPAIDWASSPVSPNETCLLLGGPFSQDANVSLTMRPPGGAAATIFVAPTQITSSSIKFVIPAVVPAICVSLLRFAVCPERWRWLKFMEFEF